jgi:hypothetical protein
VTRLFELVKSLDEDNLRILKSDIDAGSPVLKQIVTTHLRSMQRSEKICAGCNNELDETNSFTLIFGPSDFRKKASFCAEDCLVYFLAQLNQLKNKKGGRV